MPHLHPYWWSSLGRANNKTARVELVSSAPFTVSHHCSYNYWSVRFAQATNEKGEYLRTQNRATAAAGFRMLSSDTPAGHPDNVTDNDATDQEDDPIVTTDVKGRLMLPDAGSSGAGPSQAPLIQAPKVEKLRMKLRSGKVVGDKGKGKGKAPM